ncbi:MULTISPECIES: copper resistance protein NlpE N-terminal domain-containing protein [unclassified Acinetobacter]|uniref:copper resistance protein NlpE N-terminal domain-containing protein n=1 Tax=unclassified Acinetobacter TaxID=196816 RepID=UPI0012132764|nr:MULTISPECIES: copper resistance protein NlpE N-terminal domain-containing protein [unclassified Acinetobacter]RZJ21836.1 MAG: hypothetical protein EON51_09640 [Acinetobacter sp.]
MKNVVLIPLVASAALLGCQDANQSDPQNKASIESQKQIVAWAGKYEGTTPCMGCLSRCDDCPGMAVALELHEDKTYTLTRESLSGHNEIETLTGQLRFDAKDENKIELINVSTRNLLYVDLDEKVLEIRVDKTAKPYQMQSDFVLDKLA